MFFELTVCIQYFGFLSSDRENDELKQPKKVFIKDFLEFEIRFSQKVPAGFF